MAIKLPTDSVCSPETAAFAATPEGQKALEAWMDGVDFRDRFGTRRKDLSDNGAVALVFADAGVNLCEGYLVIESEFGSYAWDPKAAKWVDADDFEPLQ